ncbi:hypothetical protein J6590_100128, partial [Homalodisca vitripennis]
ETTRGVSHGAVVTVQQSARRGADEARADCLYTYSNNAWCRWWTAMTCVVIRAARF